MAGYGWKLLRQTVVSAGVFLLVLTVFQNDSIFGQQCQAVLREGFTIDSDLTPVAQMFTNVSWDSPSIPLEEQAVQVNAPFAKVTEAMAVPVAGKVIEQYGWNQEAINHSFAEGILIETAPDEQIRAAYAGTVTSLAKESDYYMIVLSHTNGLVTTYGNCSQVYIRPDGLVEKGDVIGVTANSSDTSGQLYFAAKYLGEPINPLDLLQNI